jgi:hypothetical protein
VAVTVEQVTTVCDELVDAYPAAWSKLMVASLPKLADDVLHLLLSLGLARRAEDGAWLLSRATHRWSPQPDGAPRHAEEPEPALEPEPGWSLFDHEGEVG